MTTLPAGWKLVPIEPTADMWAAVNKLDDEMAAGAYDGKGASIEQVWNCLVDAAPTPPAIAHPSRDWELDCDHCNGSGHVFVKHQVAERATDLQEFKEECECCEGRGFVFAFQDIPGIEEYVKSRRPAVPQDDTQARTGNTAKEQEMYAAGIDVGRAIERENAAVAGGAQDDAKVYHFERRSRFGPWIEVEKPTERSVEFVQRASAPAAGDAQDDQTRWTLRWIMREADAAKETCSTDPESPTAIRNTKLAAIATAAAQALGLVRGPSYADPGAGDAQDAARWRWIFNHAENVGFDYQSGRFTTLTIAGRQGDSLVAFVDAALATSQQQEG